MSPARRQEEGPRNIQICVLPCGGHRSILQPETFGASTSQSEAVTLHVGRIMAQLQNVAIRRQRDVDKPRSMVPRPARRP